MTSRTALAAVEASQVLSLRTPVLEDLPKVELRQLRYFLAVAEELNFTRAAARMGIAQPPLSQQIISLEHQLGAKLFIRSCRRVKLTPEGTELQAYARRIINTTLLATESIRSMAKGKNGQIALGAVCSAIHSLLPHILPPFAACNPGVRVHLQEMTVNEQFRALKEERIDIAIVREPMATTEFATQPLFTEPFVAAVNRHSPLARMNRLSLERIAQEPLVQVYRSTNREYSDHMFSALVERGYELNVVHEASDMHSLIGLVAAGIGMTLVPASLVNIQTANVTYVPLSENVQNSTLSLAWSQCAMTPSMDRFLKSVTAYMSSVDDLSRFWTLSENQAGSSRLAS
ncbi:LysR family transcriptional regulator [Chachezhania sediminis]|uniref:LysR family transcriptional regulator n=1 Tax=Chachezhania sediminis TaxID=2599291 RepID=UPI00131B1E7C|nr:LysR family transcriptional regulator [Chachezhania sediminis]